MSKRRYATVDCKQVDWSALAAQVTGERLVVAIDVAKEDFVAALQCVAEQTLVRVKWQHPRQTAEWLAGIEQLRRAVAVEAVMESSGVYGDALRWQLEQRAVAVYRVSAKGVHDSAESYDGVASLHDAKASEIIAKLHWEGRSRRWAPLAASRRGALAQVRWLGDCKARERVEASRLEALLSRHWPEALVILGVHSVALLQLLADYGSPAQVAALAHPARARLRRGGGAGLSWEKIDALLASAGQTLGVPCVAEERALLCRQAQQLLGAHRAVREAERALLKVSAEDPAHAAMPAPLGAVTAAVLLATAGNPADYPSARAYCKGLGLNLKEQSSGRHRGPLHITKRGPPTARFYLYFAALRLIARDPVIKCWFERKSARPGAVKLKQVVELMRKLAKAIWHQARGEPFDVNRLVNLPAVAQP